MRKFLKLPFYILLVLALALGPVLGITVQGAELPARYDGFSEGIVSSYYHIDREKGFIVGIAPGTTARQLLNVCLPGNCTVSQDRLATGATLTATCTAPTPPETLPEDTTAPADEETTAATLPPKESTPPAAEATEPPAESTESPSETTVPETTPSAPPESETKTYTLTVIVTGDLNGDGNVTITDMLMIKSAILGEQLSDTAAAAADINYDGKITITDFLKVKSCLLGLEEVTSGRPAGTAPADPLILMTPDSSESWSAPGAVTYATDDNTVAMIDVKGCITTSTQEGSTFVYALDEQGSVLSRSIVTVVSEKLTVSLGAASHRLINGQKLTLSARFNHPVIVPIHWSSSDSSVATVDDSGNVTAKGLGTATIIAALPNGSTAQATVTVVPPITSITFDKALYKVKPGASRTLGILLAPADTGEELIWSSSNTSIATVNADGTVTGVSKGTATITAKGKYSGLSASCTVKICDVKQVAITFDDGPSNHTATLLDFLSEYDIKATFFMVGNRLQSYSNTLKQMVEDGHEIGYHSYAHVLQSQLSSEQITSDFNNSSKILKELSGAEFTVWRSPGGDYNDRILKCIPLPHIGWSVDTRDWETQSSESNYQSIRKARDGDIILLHDLYSPSVNGAIRAMKEMIAGDYEFLTVTELLSRNGTAPQKHTNYNND